MAILLHLLIPGDPIPKGRPRADPRGFSFTPKRTRDAEAVITGHYRALMGDRVPISDEVGVAVEFYCATRRKSDGDNLLKLVTDPMNKIVLNDDSQIIEWFARVHRGVGKDDARTEITVYDL